ncbi:MAG: class I SAM-dependent methyltransferase, partial [Neisseriaceae bacterium]|nr:class I SAM-dependent methyltransferase [Neisseriaceae bacterium]
FDTIFNSDLPCPDVSYLDPMFPERHKTALVKKEMRFFQAAVGCDDDSADLLNKARTMPVKRIVVKRPKHGAFVGNSQPAYQYVGKSTRFDVYLPFQAA